MESPQGYIGLETYGLLSGLLGRTEQTQVAIGIAERGEKLGVLRKAGCCLLEYAYRQAQPPLMRIEPAQLQHRIAFRTTQRHSHFECLFRRRKIAHPAVDNTDIHSHRSIAGLLLSQCCECRQRFG